MPTPASRQANTPGPSSASFSSASPRRASRSVGSSEDPDFTLGGDDAKAKLAEVFGKKPKYADIAGLCKVATLNEIEAQGCSLNPGRYVGVAPGEEVSDEDFKQQLESLNEEFETLSAKARALEQTISANVAEILQG